MKKLMFIVAAALLAVGCNNAKSYVVEGNVEGFAGNVAVLTMDEEELLAEQEVTDGSFSLVVKSDHPIFALLVMEGKPIAPLFIDGSPIVVEGNVEDMTSIVAKGTPSNDAFAAFNQKQVEVMQPVMKPDATTEEVMAAFAAMQEVIEQHCVENEQNLWGLYLFLSSKAQEMEAQEILDVIESYPAEYKKIDEVAALKKQAENMLKTAVGSKYIDIALPNVDGQKMKLSDAVKANKVVLLDFWASWCRPCMGEMPYLLKAYGDYHEKGFEIYGVSLDENEQAWKGCIESNGMSWINVSTCTGWDIDAVREYAVNSIPANFLINSEGEIIAKDLRGEELAEELAKIFDQQ